jgi:glutathione S-transferase
MKLYYSPGACSLAAHVALREAGIPLEGERVDLKDKVTASGADVNRVNAKGYMPALVLDNGEVTKDGTCHYSDRWGGPWPWGASSEPVCIPSAGG